MRRGGGRGNTGGTGTRKPALRRTSDEPVGYKERHGRIGRESEAGFWVDRSCRSD